MIELPFFTQLNEGQRILLAGAGGGFDIFCGLPLYFSLKEAGKEVFLANLSFSFLPPIGEERLDPNLLRVTTDTPLFGEYFPEKFLADWFLANENETVPLYCFERTGVRPLQQAYETLITHLDIDTVVLVDGGTDSLMRGDEDGLGTPAEDIASITAVHKLTIPRKMLVCLGFSVDRFHGVSNELSLAAIAELTRQAGFLGNFSLLEQMSSVQKYKAATEYVFQQMPNDISIVSSSILSALAGNYGDHHATRRTLGSKLWINPLMTNYWCFNLCHIAERILYLDLIKDTEDFMELRGLIKAFWREQAPFQRRHSIPD
ncbi:MAG: DUF1152 domain-containing protein [Anaerolineae bacterium]|nr:DUF1152 domain-containing protein [Anaerolineae bacterium]